LGRVEIVNSVCPSLNCDELHRMNKLVVLAVFLMILWVILRVTLAVTGVFLHLLWIIAVVLAVLWLAGKLRGAR
jgi:hypothetical protein